MQIHEHGWSGEYIQNVGVGLLQRMLDGWNCRFLFLRMICIVSGWCILACWIHMHGNATWMSSLLTSATHVHVWMSSNCMLKLKFIEHLWRGTGVGYQALEWKRYCPQRTAETSFNHLLTSTRGLFPLKSKYLLFCKRSTSVMFTIWK